MFSIADHLSPRLLPYFSLFEIFRPRRGMHQNNLDLRAMPEGLQRDLGIFDGRGRRGEPDWGEKDFRQSGEVRGYGHSSEEQLSIAKLGSSLRGF
ncbi:hypothetical protein [Neorhizobium alkalisoli]|uniref:Uncharacterized protein n=1 Tax=Neorhizobium alkalisoli TaxID=528178 RepID=A0A561QWD3_9HYPH|nr:hypothetical protein [Neorhizobium alkalisoli]TWF54685.1 hypothetical protein FHW37_103555 [Neorhizobium alkalisoli]